MKMKVECCQQVPKVCRHFTGHQDKTPSPYTDITFEDSQVEGARW